MRRKTLALGPALLISAITTGTAYPQVQLIPEVVTFRDLTTLDPGFCGGIYKCGYLTTCFDHVDGNQISAATPRATEEPTIPSGDGSFIAANLQGAAGPTADVTGEPSGPDSASADSPDSSTTAADSQWHLSVTPYLWVPGVHGSVGALGRNVAFRASTWDLLKHAHVALMGAVEARYKRLLLTNDLLWIRLGADNALPLEALSAISANVTANVIILTPKIGLRLLDDQKLKIDILSGIRYWHFGENLSFSPSLLGINYSASQNWVAPVVGGRAWAPLSPKLALTILGDAGGWGAGSQIEYQIAGFLGYKMKPKWTLQAGYRYLYNDYVAGGRLGAVNTLAMSGAIFGATYDLGSPK